MKHQLLPPKESAPRLPDESSPIDAVHFWIDLMKSVDKLVMAGLTSKVGPERAKDAYRRWYAGQVDRHGQHTAQLASRLREAGEN